MSAPKPTTTRSRDRRKPAEMDLGFAWGPVNSLLLGLGVVVLLGGYLALSRGSTTLAPVLLILGYCAFIPASLIVRIGQEKSGE
jgi:hypothetical protein